MIMPPGRTCDKLTRRSLFLAGGPPQLSGRQGMTIMRAAGLVNIISNIHEELLGVGDSGMRAAIDLSGGPGAPRVTQLTLGP
jgi:hypothetical protein